MANLPEPDWLALPESLRRPTQAFGAEPSAVETALVAAFHDGKISTRGRCRTYFGDDTPRNLATYDWDRAHAVWEANEFTTPSDPVGRKVHIFSDVVVHREDLEKWINGATPGSQRGPQEPAENPAPEETEDKPKLPRKKPAKADHDRWIARAAELKQSNKKMPTTQIATKIQTEEFERARAKAKDDFSIGKAAPEGMIRRVLTTQKSKWNIPQEN